MKKKLSVEGAIEKIEEMFNSLVEGTSNTNESRGLRRERLKKILKQLRVGYVKDISIEDMDPAAVALRLCSKCSAELRRQK
jgi:hypothetical protein